MSKVCRGLMISLLMMASLAQAGEGPFDQFLKRYLAKMTTSKTPVMYSECKYMSVDRKMAIKALLLFPLDEKIRDEGDVHPDVRKHIYGLLVEQLEDGAVVGITEVAIAKNGEPVLIDAGGGSRYQGILNLLQKLATAPFTFVPPSELGQITMSKIRHDCFAK